jgi:hypothetical protein
VSDLFTPSDSQLIDFVEKVGVQVWPMRKSGKLGQRTPGDIANWTAQLPHPNFLQVTNTHWRTAVAALLEAYKRRAEDTPA